MERYSKYLEKSYQLLINFTLKVTNPRVNLAVDRINLEFPVVKAAKLVYTYKGDKLETSPKKNQYRVFFSSGINIRLFRTPFTTTCNITFVNTNIVEKCIEGIKLKICSISLTLSE